MAQPGMGVMIGMLGGNAGTVEAYQSALNKKIASVALKDDELKFVFEDGTKLIARDDGQSCCEHRYMVIDDDLAPFVLPTTEYEVDGSEAMAAVFTPQGVEVVIDRNLLNELAAKLSRALVAYEAISTVNIAGKTIDQRVEIDKHHRITGDKLAYARREYDEAFKAWAKAGFP